MIKLLKQATSYIFFNVRTIPKLIHAEKCMKKGDSNEALNLAKNVVSKYSKSLVELSGSTVNIYNKEYIPTNEAVLFVANHQGNFDVLSVLGYLTSDVSFVAKKELDNKSIMNRWMKLLGCIYLDRDNPRSAIKTISEGVDILKNGRSLFIFPEGTRSRCSKMNEFKAGSFKLATKSGVKIVPITINNTYKVMEENGLPLKPANISIYVHEPVDISSFSKEELKIINKKIENIVKSKIE